MTQTILRPVAEFSVLLANSVEVGNTTADLNTALDNDGIQLTNEKYYGFTVDSGSAKEYIVAYLDNDTELSQIYSISRQGAGTSGFSKKHRIGVQVQITDWATLSRITNLLDGTTDFDAGTPLAYDGAPAQTDPNAFATVQFVLDTAAGGAVTFDALVFAGVAGEALTAGDWVYLKESDGQWYKTDADDAAKCVGVKIGKCRATTSAEAGIVGGVFVGGLEKVGTYTDGQRYYLSNTAGALFTTPGTIAVTVGAADDNGDLVFFSQYDTGTTPDTVAALAGNVGTPSATNKFVTEQGVNAGVYFGDGSDGDVTISSPTTLTRNMYYNNLVVTDTLTTNGFLIFVKETISGAGTITYPTPTAASGQSGGVAFSGASYGALLNSTGGAGGNGGNTAGANGSAGVSGYVGTAGSAGGNNGSGGDPSTGGAGGTNVGTQPSLMLTLIDLIIGSTTPTKRFPCSSGGGGGGSHISGSVNTGNRGGGGGASGGIVFIAANIWSGTFTIRSVGGAAAAGGNGVATSASGGGGGGGGAGGNSIVVYGYKTWTGSYTLTGGAAGTGGTGTGSGGSGASGTIGATGKSYEIKV